MNGIGKDLCFAMQSARQSLLWETSELIAILWHQGESDSCGGRYKNYYQKLSTLVNSFRKELDVPEVPFIVGGLGDYLGKSGFGKSSVEYNFINQELHKYAENNRNCYFVTGKELNPNQTESASMRIPKKIWNQIFRGISHQIECGQATR